jgi:hypothetical protein
MTFSNFLANGGDEVRLLDPTEDVLDATSYTYSTAERSWYRFPDGGRWSTIDSDNPTPGDSNPGFGDNPWQPGSFEIRIFDVDQGDSQLIIFPSGYSILIDVREASWNSSKGEASVEGKKASKRPLTQAKRKCSKWLNPSSLQRMPTPLKRC